MKVLNPLRLFLVIVGISFSIPAHAQEVKSGIVVKDAWVLAMPPSQGSTAAFMTIENNTDKEVVLESASSDIAEKTQIHSMSHVNGMMHMGLAGDIHIPAKGKVVLEHGGLHMMLINLKKPSNKGDVVSITLNFHGGQYITVNAQVREETEDNNKNMSGTKM